MQRVHGEKPLTQKAAKASADGGFAELSSIHGYYAARIAAIRATMRPEQAVAMIRNLRIEKTLAVRNAKNRRRADRAARNPTARAPVRPAFRAVQLYRRYG